MSLAFPNLQARLAILLLMAAGCQPVRDELFRLEPLTAGAGQVAPPPPSAAAGGSAGSNPTPMTPDAGPITVPGGSAGADSRLNPDIGFRWTETIPGAGACQAGKFIGTFSCQVNSLIAPDKLDGLITIVVTGSSEAQLLTVDTGQVVAYDANRTLVVAAPINGSLDCNTQALDVDILPTTTAVMPLDRQLAWLNLAERPTVSGTIKGALDPSKQEISGDVVLVFEPAPMCSGTFTVRLSP